MHGCVPYCMGGGGGGAFLFFFFFCSRKMSVVVKLDKEDKTMIS